MTKPESRLYNFRHDRTAMTLLLAGMLILVMGMLRPDKPRGVPPKRFWAAKITWRHCADVVITGDSRALMSLAPAQLESVFPKTTVLNFGFPGNPYSQQYLDAVENVLKPDSAKRRIIMGVTPHSLTRRAHSTSYFRKLSAIPDERLEMHKTFAPVLEFLKPMSLRDAWHGLFPQTAESTVVTRYYPDGFLAVHRTPCRLNELKKYREIFRKKNVSDDLIRNLLDRVRMWIRQGIIVYGFYPPTCERMVKVERNGSGFDRTDFIRRFTQAGGIWLHFDPTAYQSVDGSHLQDTAAFRFSRTFAQRLLEHEPQPPHVYEQNQRDMPRRQDVIRQTPPPISP